LNDTETGRRRHLLDKGAGRFRSVRVDDGNAQPADHRMAEYGGQDHEGEQRHAEYQDERGAVMRQPSPFARGDQEESGFRPFHPRVRQSK
jgi:hypothetical protein